MLQERVAHLEARLERLERPPSSPPSPSLGADTIVPVDAHWEEAVAWSGDVTVHGAVAGPVIAVGGDVWVGPEARVEGNLVSLGGQIHVHPDASVQGDRVGLSPSGRDVGLIESAARRLSLVLGLAALVVLGVGLADVRTRNIADTLRQGAGWYVIGGGILTAAAAVVGTVSLLSIVAAPVGVAVFSGVAIAWSLGMVGVCRWIGESIPGAPRAPRSAALTGAVVVGVLIAVPVVGPLLAVLTGMAAIGSSMMSRLGRRAALDI